MRLDEATQLITRMLDAWPRGMPSAATWEEEFAELDAGRAGTAFARLRRERNNAPSVSEFLAAYRAVDVSGPRSAECDDCAGSGWRHVDPPEAHQRSCTGPNERGWCCDGVSVPCHCVDGNRARRWAEQHIAEPDRARGAA